MKIWFRSSRMTNYRHFFPYNSCKIKNIYFWSILFFFFQTNDTTDRNSLSLIRELWVNIKGENIVFIFNVLHFTFFFFFSHSTFALVVHCGVFRLLKTDCANMHMHHVLGINVASRYSLFVLNRSRYFSSGNVSLSVYILYQSIERILKIKVADISLSLWN